MQFPQETKEGVIFIDFLEFTPKVSWQNMSDAQYKVNRKDYSLVSDFVSYRNTTPQVKKIITAEDQQIKIIADRLTTWYLGSGQQSSDKWIKMREDNEEVLSEPVSKLRRKLRYNIMKTIPPKESPCFQWVPLLL